jgi:hypothetical protein
LTPTSTGTITATATLTPTVTPLLFYPQGAPTPHRARYFGHGLLGVLAYLENELPGTLAGIYNAHPVGRPSSSLTCPFQNA